jgi:hypothetical protein
MAGWLENPIFSIAKTIITDFFFVKHRIVLHEIL